MVKLFSMKTIDSGAILKSYVDSHGISPKWLAIQLNCHRTNLYKIFKIYALKEQKAQLDMQIQEALVQQSELQKQVDKMSKPEEMERIAREQLGYVLPGEVVMKKIEDNNSSNE